MPQCGQTFSGDADLKACTVSCTDAPVSGSDACLADGEPWACKYILPFHSSKLYQIRSDQIKLHLFQPHQADQTLDPEGRVHFLHACGDKFGNANQIPLPHECLHGLRSLK